MTGFLDTNILVHALDPRSPNRAEAVRHIGPPNRIGVQSLNEFAVVCRRKLGMGWSEIRRATAAVGGLIMLPPVPLTMEVHEAGLDLAQRYQLQIYDALLLAAALSAGCTSFLSEDMHDGLRIDSRLTIRNPFA